MHMILGFILLGRVFSQDASKQNEICNQCECLDPQVVDCTEMELTEFPDWSDGLQIPRLLQLGGNFLKQIPQLPKMENLKELSFKHNMINEIVDAAFINVTNLYRLDLSHNQLNSQNVQKEAFKGPYSSSLPNPLENLTFLDLSYNEFEKIADRFFFHLPNLTILSLRGNPFQDLSLRSIESFTEIPYLTDLDLAYCGLSRLPDHIFSDLRLLKTLDLSGNLFTTIPYEINFVPTLETLFLNDILIKDIFPGSFYETLSNLEVIHLNKLPELITIQNYAFANLTGLRKLWIENNPKLSYLLPYAFSSPYSNLTLHIEEVHLQHNWLRNLPREAVDWTSIDHLDLQNNPWHCDCNFQYIVDGLIRNIAERNREITLQILCATPEELAYQRVLNERVQLEKFECYTEITQHTNALANFLVVTAVVIGCFLFVGGVLFFAYLLMRRKQGSSDWVGDRVKYRRATGVSERNTFY